MHYLLSFTIKDTTFAVPIEEVREIARPKSMFIKKKGSRKNMLGHFKLRGVRVPLYDLSSYLALDHDDNLEVIVIDRKGITIGIRVDKVLGIVTAQDIMPYPELIPRRAFRIGVISETKPLMQVISLHRIFTSQRIRSIKTYLSKQTL